MHSVALLFSVVLVSVPCLGAETNALPLPTDAREVATMADTNAPAAAMRASDTNALAEIIAVASNAAVVAESVEEAETFEVPDREKLEQVTDAKDSTRDFEWDIRWEKGLRYELVYRQPLWARLYLDAADKETKLSGTIGMKLDLDASFYKENGAVTVTDDEFAVRRFRLYTAGYFRYVFPAFYRVEVEVADSEVYIREVYLWLDDMPWVSTLKVGHFKAPSTLDQMISSRDRSFMESASPVEAFSQGIKFGIQASDHTGEQRATWAFGWFADGETSDINDATDSLTRLLGRLTWLALDDPEQQRLLHMGVSGGWVYTGDRVVQYRSRPESYLAPRLVDTGGIPAKDAWNGGLELAAVAGPFHMQAETLYARVQRAEPDLLFGGAYGSFGWFITGESRPYRRQTGVFGQVIPLRPFNLRAREWGGWEIVMRYSDLNLTDQEIDGGRMRIAMGGLNWYLNDTTGMAFEGGYADVEGGATPGSLVLAQARLKIHF